MRLENRQLSVIDKIYINGGLLLKKAVCCNSRQGICNEVVKRMMSGVFYLSNILQFVINCFYQGSFSKQNLVSNTHQ